MALLAAILHASLVGVLLGFTASPIVGAIAPSLLTLAGAIGVGWVSGRSPTDASRGLGPRAPSPLLFRLVAAWSAAVMLSLFVSIGVRTHRVDTADSIAEHLAPAASAPDGATHVARVLLARRMDQLQLSSNARRELAGAISRIVQTNEALLLLDQAKSLAEAEQAQRTLLYGSE